MSTPDEKTELCGGSSLEMEFSSAIAENFTSLYAVIRSSTISSAVVYIEEEDLRQWETLREFFRQMSGKNVKCKAACPWKLYEHSEVLPFRGIPMRLRICSPQELEALLKSGRVSPEDDIELCYDETVCADWNMAEAMEECARRQIGCVFGCSDSFVSISREKLEIICGNKGKTPFPGENNCLRFVNSLFLAKDGTFYPCKGMKNLPVGTLFSDSVEEVLANSSVLEYYKDFARKIKKPCKNCPEFPTCAGCRGRAHKFSSDFLGSDFLCPNNIPFADQITKLPIKDPENYLPHKKPMLLVSELSAVYDNSCETISLIQPDNPFLQKEGTLDHAAFVEIGAQSMAFLDSFLHPETRLQGMLVEINRFSCCKYAVYPGTKLRTVSRKIYEMPPWSIGSFEVFSMENTLIAAGEVKVCQFAE